jgi:flavorubredoxin
MIDTLKFARHMQERGGMTKEAAEALAEGINEAAIDQLVTKQELKLAVSELKNTVWGAAFSIVLALGVLQHFLR